MCGRMVDIQSPTAEIRRGKKEDRRNHRIKYNGLPYFIGDHKEEETTAAKYNGLP